MVQIPVDPNTWQNKSKSMVCRVIKRWNKNKMSTHNWNRKRKTREISYQKFGEKKVTRKGNISRYNETHLLQQQKSRQQRPRLVW